MSTLLQRCLAGALSTAISVTLLSGCVVDGGGGYAYGGGDVDVGVDYYQPVGGVVVGGWGPGYHVGPPPRGGDRPGPGGHPEPGGARGVPGGNSGGHAYRPPSSGRSAPSIPSHSAPSGGGGGGGSHHR